jgi:3-methyladenine DNA glycosylase AlkD
LPTAIRAGLRAAAEPERAPAMQAYMRSTMPFLGVRVPVVRRIVRTAAAADPPAGPAAVLASATTLWREAGFREERYAATELLGLRIARGRLEALGLITEVIVTGAWWDHVDAVAHHVGALLRAHPADVEPVVRAWSVDPDRWLRRASIICQLDAREQTDLSLLTDVIDANLADREFFVRKAIGWALRQFARTDPAWVRAFVAARRDTLSPLSYREAVKHLAQD